MKSTAARKNSNLNLKLASILFAVMAVSIATHAAPEAKTNGNGPGAFGQAIFGNSTSILPTTGGSQCNGRSEDTPDFEILFGFPPVPELGRWGTRFVDAALNCDERGSFGGNSGADGVDAMDFDGDCDLDIVTGWEESGTVFVYLNPLFSVRPAAGCPARHWPVNTQLRSSHRVAQQWPFLEVKRQDTNDPKPFDGVEDAIFADHNNDKIADYIVIATEGTDGRQETFVSVPTPSGSSFTFNTFRLTGEELYMRAVVKDIDKDGCPDILVGSKTPNDNPGNPTGDIRWWHCNRDGDVNEWEPDKWKSGEKDIMSMDANNNGHVYDDLRDLWGNHHSIASNIEWIMEMNVVNIVKGFNRNTARTGNVGIVDYPEILFTDRRKIGYMYLKDAKNIKNQDNWEFVRIDNPNDSNSPFRWYQIGQLIDGDNDGDLSPDDPDEPFEIVAAYDDNYGRGVFARWYKCRNWNAATGCGPTYNGGIWDVSEIIVDADPNNPDAIALPWHAMSNKATGMADINGDGKSEVIATIRGKNFSGIFSLSPLAGTPPLCFQNCTDNQQWTFSRISPYFNQVDGEIKYDNLALIDVDIDCDIDIFSVEENLGGGKGLGTVWSENPLSQGGANTRCSQPVQNSAPVINTGSFFVVDEGTTISSLVSVTDADDDVEHGQFAVDKGTLTVNSPGVWTWTYTAGDGPSQTAARFTALDERGAASERIIPITELNVAPTISLVTGPAQINEGSSAIVSVHATDPVDDILYEFDCDGNGTYEVGPTFSFSWGCFYDNDGLRRINVRVADGDGGIATAFANVTVLNVAPAITSTILSPVTGAAVEGNTYRLSATFTDPGADTFSCSISYGDGSAAVPVSPIPVGPAAYKCEDITHIYRDNGGYTATVTIGDGAASVQSTSAISVSNVAPSVELPTINPSQSVDVNTPVTASATFSDPGAVDAPFVCMIDFGAGSGFVAGVVSGTNCTSQAPNLYAAVGDYTVTFRVTDKDGGNGTSSRTVSVQNLPPVVAIPAISIASVAEGDSFNAASTFTDGGDNGPYSCVVNYGDGTGDQPGTIIAEPPACSGPLHVYQDNGQYQVRITVTDQDNVSGQNSRDVNVSNVAPLVTATGMTISENGVATVSGTISDPGPLDTFSILINWADGSTESLSVPAGTSVYSRTHQYLDDNPTSTPIDTVIAVVQVTDDDNGVGAAGASVTINNIAPVASIDSITDSFGNLVGPVPPNDVGVLLEALGFSISASFSDTGTLDTHVASIDWGDGTSWNAPAAGPVSRTHTYANPGDYVITFMVTDDDVGSSTLTRTVTVVSAAGALVDVIEALQAALNDPNLDPQIRTLLQRALNELAGQAGGTGDNGALSLLRVRAWTAMLEKIENAVEDLEQAGMDTLASQLVMAVKSLLVGLVNEAEARAQLPIELNAVAQARIWIANGDAALTLAGKLQAYENAILALRPALQSLPGQANYNMNDVTTSNYSFIASVTGKGTPGTNDQLGLKRIDLNYQTVTHFNFIPLY